MKPAHLHPLPPQSRQRGIAILVAMIILVAMSLAGIALMRSVDTASLIAGNIAFRQGATLAGDGGIESARTYLLNGATVLTANSVANGYYASNPAGIDLTGNRTTDKSKWVKWADTQGTGPAPTAETTDAAGNKVSYIIHRLCDNTGALDPATCYTYTEGSKSGGGQGGRIAVGGGMQGKDIQPPAPQGYYRITVRTRGPRNNISFLQVFIKI
jgi:type IV pilus assembly protein PilX